MRLFEFIFIFASISNLSLNLLLDIVTFNTKMELFIYVSAKFAITIAYSTIILHSSEVYPTKIRYEDFSEKVSKISLEIQLQEFWLWSLFVVK